MYTEYYINNIDENDTEIKRSIQDLVDCTTIKNVVTLSYHTKLIKKFFPQLFVGAFVDYPISNTDLSRRQDLISDALKNDISCIAISTPAYLLVNRKYEKLRDDIKKNLDLCGQNIELRYILEYRKFDHQLMAKVCDVLISCGIKTVYPSSGFFLDSLEDNILACSYLKQKTGINTIINGNCWNSDHIKKIKKSNLYGFSGNTINTLKNIN